MLNIVKFIFIFLTLIYVLYILKMWGDSLNSDFEFDSSTIDNQNITCSIEKLNENNITLVKNNFENELEKWGGEAGLLKK